MNTNILIVESRFYQEITDNLLDGAKAAIEAAGATFERMEVPGILEIPAGVLYAVRAGASPAAINRRYDGFITLGCAILGETDHYHHVSREAMNGIQSLVLEHALCLGNGILTVHNRDQAMERCLPTKRDFGGQAARAALAMVKLKRDFASMAK